MVERDLKMRTDVDERRHRLALTQHDHPECRLAHASGEDAAFAFRQIVQRAQFRAGQRDVFGQICAGISAGSSTKSRCSV